MWGWTKIKNYKGTSAVSLSFNEKGDVPGREKDYIVLIIKDGKFRPTGRPSRSAATPSAGAVEAPADALLI